MTTEVIFNIVKSEIDHRKELESFTDWNDKGELDGENNPNAYLEFDKHAARPAINWCIENNITDFSIEQGEFAMRIVFVFKYIEDAVAFKLRWNSGIK